MSTYNGEKYLSEQIESIRAQSVKNWSLLIRDDGSKDSTVDIIKKYVLKDERITFINEMDIKNVGVHRSFYELIKYDEADFYFFCDQDDFWKEDKISIFLKKINLEEQHNPHLYYSNLSTVDKNLELIKYKLYSKQQDIYSNIVGNKVAGCVMMINASLAEKWVFEDIGLHDSFLVMMALSMGNVIFIEEPTILYRQHESNVIGDKGKENIIENFWSMIKTSRERSKKIVDTYSGCISEENQEIMKNFCKLGDVSFFKRFSILMKYPYTRNNWKETFVLKVLLLTQYKNKYFEGKK